jgi:hypothetical protein
MTVYKSIATYLKGKRRCSDVLTTRYKHRRINLALTVYSV